MLQAIRQLEGGQQLTVLQDIVAKLGYSPTDGTSKVKEPIVSSRKLAPRKKVTIKGIDNAQRLKSLASWCRKSSRNGFQRKGSDGFPNARGRRQYLGGYRGVGLTNILNWRIIMSKEKKGNRESKKPKASSDGTKKQKKDPKRYDDLFGRSK